MDEYSFRYWDGVFPVTLKNVLLNEVFVLNPASKAISRMVFSASAAEPSLFLTSSMR